MNRHERLADHEDPARAHAIAEQAELWTALPGIIVSFDPDAITVVAKSALKMKRKLVDNTVIDEEMPQFVDVPVVPQRGGGCTLTFPIKPGDECLLVFADRCIDAWWQNGGVQPLAEFRLHDLSDGFAIVGQFSQKTKITEWSTAQCELRSNDHEAYVAVHPTTHLITVTTTGDIIGHADGNITVDAGGDIEATAVGEMTLRAAFIHLNP